MTFCQFYKRLARTDQLYKKAAKTNIKHEIMNSIYSNQQLLVEEKLAQHYIEQRDITSNNTTNKSTVIYIYNS
jgi:hypothetical protein